MAEAIVLAVSAYFVESRNRYRVYELDSSIAPDAVARLIVRGHGRADLLRRAYAVSKTMAKQLNPMLASPIEWDFKSYFYQIGAFQKSSDVLPERFLLAQRDARNGDIIRYFAPRGASAEISKILGGEIFERYEDVFVEPRHLSSILPLFHGAGDVEGKGVYFELTPVLLSQRKYYLDNFGIELR